MQPTPAAKPPASKPAEGTPAAKPPVKPAASPATTPAATDEEGVRKAIKAYVAAINAGDFKTVADLWTADGDYSDPAGKTFKARSVIEEELTKRFAGPDRPRLSVEVQTLRLVSPDVALEDGTAQMTPAGGGEPSRGRYTMVWVKQQDKWLISSLRELAVSPTASAQRLSDLAWLVGDWTAEADGTTIHVACEWSPGRSYLLREITIHHTGQHVQSVSQRIAFDPQTRRLKMWSFDGDGSHAEGYWSKQGETWVAQSTGITRDGRPTRAKNIYRDIDSEAFLLESTGAEVGGETRPDFKLPFHRQADE